MSEIRQWFSYDVEPEQLYAALTEEDQIREWWTVSCNIMPVEGTTGRIEFLPDGAWVDLAVIELDPDRRVEYEVRGSWMHETEEWNGTRLHFTIGPDHPFGAELDLVHSGFTAETACFRASAKAWAFYLGESLKSYLESGEGQPRLLAD